MRGRGVADARGIAIVLLAGAGLAGAVTRPLAAPQHADPDALLMQPGASLRVAVAAIEAGDWERAERLVTQIAARHPIVADYADLLRMRLLVEGRRFEEAAALMSDFRHARSPTRVEQLELLGRARSALGQEFSARTAWEQATRSTRSRDRLASLHSRIAESFSREGKLAQAAEAWRRIWVGYPEQPQAEVAERSLESLERELGRVFRDARHTFERAETLFAHYRNEEALAAYDQALALGLPEASRRRAAAGRAETLFRLRRYPEAALAYAALPDSEEHRIQQARAHARSGQVARGARELETLGDGSGTAQGTRALLIAALLWEGEDGGFEHARRLYERVIRRAPGSAASATARWQLGWEAYRSRRYAEAIAHFEHLEREEPDPISALRPRYWTLRAREHDGDDDAAHGYAQLAREYPLTYYGWRAALRAPRALDAVPREPQAIPPGTRALSSTELERGRILVEAGLTDLARDQLARLDRAARGLVDRLSLAQLHADLGDFDRAQRLALDAYGEELSRGPVPEQLELWWYAWPAPFESEVREVESAGVRLDTALLYSIMREESGYRPGVVSVAGARGLLQLMPATAERVAREMHLEDFSADDLFLPSVNIRLGSAYLEALLREFDGRRSAAIGSYNAGPHVVARWVRSSTGDDDEFVEEIPYNQTRAYVKRVMRSLHAYRVLY